MLLRCLLPSENLIVGTAHFLALFFALYYTLVHFPVQAFIFSLDDLADRDRIILLADEWKMPIFELASVKLGVQTVGFLIFGRTGVGEGDVGLLGRNGSRIVEGDLLGGLVEDA